MVYAFVRIAVLSASFLGLLTQAADAKDTIAALLASPSSYSGKPVLLIGKVFSAIEIPGGSPKHPKPPKYNLRFCDGSGACIRAVTDDAVSADETALWRLQGTFHAGEAGTPNWIGDAGLSSFTPPPDAPSPKPTGT